MKELEVYKWAVERGLFPKPESIPGPSEYDDIYLRKLRRLVEDQLRKDKTLILPVAQLLGVWEIRRRRRRGGKLINPITESLDFDKGGRDELHRPIS
jgi:hypothetical protein